MSLMKWKTGNTKIIIATNAFGMGINTSKKVGELGEMVRNQKVLFYIQEVTLNYYMESFLNQEKMLEKMKLCKGEFILNKDSKTFVK